MIRHNLKRDARDITANSSQAMHSYHVFYHNQLREEYQVIYFCPLYKCYSTYGCFQTLPLLHPIIIKIICLFIYSKYKDGNSHPHNIRYVPTNILYTI